MEILFVLLYFFLTICTIIYVIVQKHYSYWKDRGIVCEKPALFYGNLREFGRTQPLRQPFRDFYMKYKRQMPFGGFYLSLRRAAVIFDLELAKNILIKDFPKFSARGNYYNEKDDPLSAHLFNLDGPKWRQMRTKLTPTFTSGKMRFMFPTVVEVATKFVDVLQNLAMQQNCSGEPFAVEVKELLTRYTTDVIGTCAFGIECNSLTDPNNEFRAMGKKVFAGRRHGRIVSGFISAFPNIAQKLGVKVAHSDVSEFFMRIVRENVEYREREGIQRNDFMNLLIELKNNNETGGLTLEEISAQAFVFFVAGFETSSSTMGFCLYELVMNQEIQDKARKEICDMFERYEGKLTYEGMKELRYLQQVLCETMRLYSIASIIMRQTVEDYTVPKTNQVLEKGITIVIPVDAIHRDPDIYPSPEVFNPDRFELAEIEKRHSLAFLPFGDGPRNCIGMRFGEMQAMIGLVMLLKNFRFTAAKETQIPIEINIKSFILASKGGIVLNVEKL